MPDLAYYFDMKPDAALSLQIKRYREMTGEQRLALALELHELACEVARAGIKARHSTADAVEIERLLIKSKALPACRTGAARRPARGLRTGP
jgi:hypothetical protein